MSFSRPEFFLLLLLIPLMLGAAVLASRARGASWRKLVAARLQPILVRKRSQVRRWISLGVAMLAFLFLVISLTGPNAGYEETPETIRGRNLLVAIDVSRSMLATDVSPNRLAAARAAALEMLDQFPNDRIGIIAFSGISWLQAPLTIDHTALRETLEQLSYHGEQEEWLPRGGSDIAGAVALAIKTFKETGQRNNALIVLSDGESHEGGLEAAAEDAEEAGVTIFTVGFGSDEGSFIPEAINMRGRGTARVTPLPPSLVGKFHDRNGNVVLTRLDAANLRLLSNGTGGFYTEGSGPGFTQNLGRAVQRLDEFELEGRNRRVEIPRFQWFLLPAILLFIVSMLIDTSWRLGGKSAMAVLLAILAFTPTLEGGIIPPTKAEQSFESGDFERSLAFFEEEVAAANGERKARLQLGEGAAAYKTTNYTHALRAYSGALLSRKRAVQEQAHFGLGNTHFYKGLQVLGSGPEAPQPDESAVKATVVFWEDSISHFDGVLALNPDNKKAYENRELVKKRLEDLLKKQEEQQPEEPEKGEPQSDPKGNQDNPPDQPPPPDPPPAPENPDGENEDPKKPSKPPEPREDETPEEYARRILSENADFENRPVPLRLRRPPRPEKNW